MSYVSSFVHAQPEAKIVAGSTIHNAKTLVPAKATAGKEATTKIVMFIAILACLVLAVNI